MAPKAKAGTGNLRAPSGNPQRSPSPKAPAGNETANAKAKAKAESGNLRAVAASQDPSRSPRAPSPKAPSGTDSSQLGKAKAPPPKATSVSVVSSVSGSQRPHFIRKAFQFKAKQPGFAWGDDARVESVEPGGEAKKQGIEEGWKIVEIGGESISRIGDSKQTRFKRRITEAIRLKSTYHGAYTITFVFPAPPFDEELVKQQEVVLERLEDMSEKERCENLGVLEKFNVAEKDDLLKRPKACNSLLHHGYDELTVLFGEKTAAAVQANHNAWAQLKSGITLDADRLAQIDLAYADAQGNTPLHMAASHSSAKKLLEAAKKATPDVLLRRNKRGEMPLEAMLRQAKAADDRAAILEMYKECAPEALSFGCANSVPMSLVLGDEERKLLPESIPWEDIRQVLLASDLAGMQRGYAGLSKRICKARSDLEPSDHAAVWTALMSEHCFGCLDSRKDASGASRFSMSATSRERLEDVWKAAKLLLECSANENIEPGDDLPGEPNTALKGLARGVLASTMGPLQANFDPRETYRERIVALVNELQLSTAARLKEVLDKQSAAESEFAAAVANDIPADALHSLVPSGATVRGRPTDRLRVDSRVIDLTEEIAPVPTPEWVLAQQIDMGMVETLKNADCIKKARDLCELVETKSSALSAARLRFACLHVAWVWSFCGEHLHGVNSTIREKLGLSTGSKPDSFPCPGSGDFIIRSFRARHEPKGLPRLLEKTQEAIDEEVGIGKSASILKLDADTSVEPEDLKEDQLALLELLTPGCYVCDIVGAEVSVETFKGMLSLYKKLSSMTLAKDGLQVVRTKNGFSKDAAAAAGGYKDLKLWVMVACEGRSVVAELQVHIESVLQQKKFMHLSYECFRGSFDHPHLQATWQQKPKETPKPADAGPPKKGCCCAKRSGKSSKVAPEA